MVNLSILFLLLFQFMEGHKRILRLFSVNLPAMFFIESVMLSKLCGDKTIIGPINGCSNRIWVRG